MENIVVAVFPVESEAYQAFSKIKDGTTDYPVIWFPKW